MTCSPLTTTTWVRVLAAAGWAGLCAAHGMSFTIQSQYLVVFHQGFSSIIRRAQNFSGSDWNCLIRLRLAWIDVDLRDMKHGFVVLFLFFGMTMFHIS